MRSASGALAYLEQQRVTNATGWGGLCERLARSAYGLAAHFPSANAHAAAIPTRYRHGHERPSPGDLLLCTNSRFGHIAVCTGVGWNCYTNDYGGYGRVSIADARDLPAWCGASSWFIADAYWSSSSLVLTHSSPLVVDPDPYPNPGSEPAPPIEPVTYIPEITGSLVVNEQRFDPINWES
jgi:hypothetical protein